MKNLINRTKRRCAVFARLGGTIMSSTAHLRKQTKEALDRLLLDLSKTTSKIKRSMLENRIKVHRETLKELGG